MNRVEEEGCAIYCRKHNKFLRDHQASKTQGSLPRAQQISQAEGAIIEPAKEAGGNKEGVQSRSMAPRG
jgi:hypothetical protein